MTASSLCCSTPLKPWISHSENVTAGGIELNLPLASLDQHDPPAPIHRGGLKRMYGLGPALPRWSATIKTLTGSEPSFRNASHGLPESNPTSRLKILIFLLHLNRKHTTKAKRPRLLAAFFMKFDISDCKIAEP